MMHSTRAYIASGKPRPGRKKIKSQSYNEGMKVCIHLNPTNLTPRSSLLNPPLHSTPFYSISPSSKQPG